MSDYPGGGVAVGYTELQIVDAEQYAREMAAAETGEIVLRGLSFSQESPGESSAVWARNPV